ncbi:hypothetical protein EC968_000822 [Mortierella alpina]|nr:hypothetical protein EC968_000822 [Mortierella alpina]
MDTLKEDLIHALEEQGRDEQEASCSKHDAPDGNSDQQLCTNTSITARPHFRRGASVPSTDSTAANNNASSGNLPPEIWLSVLRWLTVSQLLSCHMVSRLFRSMARTTMMDKLGARFMETQRWSCRRCRERQRQQQRQPSSPQRGQPPHNLQNGRSGLPPLPQNHLSTASIGIISSLLQYPMSKQEYPDYSSPTFHGSYSDDPDQFVEETSLASSHSPVCVHESAQRARTRSDRPPAGFVAPGTIALILFPTNEHATASWQQRQRVHFWCTGMDRLQEQLIFSPMDSEENFFKFSTSSYSLSPSSHLLATNRDNANGARDVGWRVPATAYTGFAPGQRVFNYQTGKPTTDSSGTTGYDFIQQFSGKGAQQQANTSERHPSPPPPASSSSGGSSMGSTSSTPASTSSVLSSAHSRRSSWSSVSGYGGDHHSVIGIQHGDWFEDPAAFSGGMWSGIHSVSEREPMIFMPWTLAPTTLRDEEKMQQQQQGRGRSWSWEPSMEQSSPMGGRFCQAMRPSVRTEGDPQGSSSTEIHQHHVHLSNHPKRPTAPKHHHRYFCLHHDQIMADVAAANNKDLAMDPPSGDMGKRRSWSTAGSKHLKIYYEAEVKESNRCLYCISSPCKATLEIKLKVYQLKVSLDWILSGIPPEPNQTTVTSNGNTSSKDRGPGQLPA